MNTWKNFMTLSAKDKLSIPIRKREAKATKKSQSTCEILPGQMDMAQIF